ncbi:MAG TPA: hypothetical protein PLU17_11685 [Chitinophagaceae bacterium]|nr:hypothetical protein [Chitinophagaceae bacterium]
MSKKEVKKKEIQENAQPNATETKGFLVRFPLLILSAIVLFLYMGSINFGFTELDDTIFVKELHPYNEQISNLVHSFKRGVFSEKDDTYYRPMLLNSFIINNSVSDTNVQGYHAMNVFFHLISVLLLFILFKKLDLDPLKAFLLSLLFAVHPVLSQAVAWIPGRNDTLLAIFSFGFMIFALDYLSSHKLKFLFLQILFLLAALFTKETAVFIAPAFLILCFIKNDFKWNESKNFLLYGSWLLAIVIWFIVRSSATLKHDIISYSDIASHFLVRLSLTVQYLGKIILPFNLSVFPMLKETSYLFGIVAIILLGVLLYFSKSRNLKIVLAGFGWFLILLFPLFILPSSINDQDFEHRLYLPIVGILVILSQTALFSNLKTQTSTLIVLGICALFFVMNLIHQQNFKDSISFWESAVETTPKSSYANMMLAARLDGEDKSKAKAMMRNAYNLNPKEKYVNYYIGKDFLNENQIDSAQKYFLDELKGSAYFDTYFLLSRVSFLKNDTVGSLKYMGMYLEKDRANSQAINNYILMLTQNNQVDKADQFIQQKQKEGILVPTALIEMVNQAKKNKAVTQ